jgi:nucleoid-associated protein EbfC
MDFSNLMKTAQGMQSKMAAVQASLKERVIDGSAGSGMVTAYVNGDMELVKIEIDPKVVDADDVEMLEDLVLAAVNKAMTEMKALTQQEMSKVTGGMNIPGLF